jgi:hypothetical protein
MHYTGTLTVSYRIPGTSDDLLFVVFGTCGPRPGTSSGEFAISTVQHQPQPCWRYRLRA